MLEGVIREIGLIIGSDPIRMLISRLSRDEEVLKSLEVGDNFSVCFAGLNNSDIDSGQTLNALKILMDHLVDFSANIFGDEASERMMARALEPFDQEIARMCELNLAAFLPRIVDTEIHEKKRGVAAIIDKNRIEQVLVIFEDILSAYLEDASAIGLIELYRRKISSLPPINSISSPIVITDDGSVSLSRLNNADLDVRLLVDELASISDSFIDTASFLIGKKEALSRAENSINPVLARFQPLTDELGITDKILKGNLARRISTGVNGFDEIIEGGFPRSGSILLQGPPGIEKDAFINAFLRSGLSKGYAAMAVLSKYTPADLRIQMRDTGIDLIKYEDENVFGMVDWNAWRGENVNGVEEGDRSSVLRSSRDLSYLSIAINKVLANLDEVPTRLAVIDILSPAINDFDFETVYDFTQSLRIKFKKEDVTALFLIDNEMHDGKSLSAIQEIFDGVIEIERQRVDDQIIRKIGVIHMDRTYFDSKYKTLKLSREGIKVVSEEESL
ncbi:MAG: Circadian clock protein KaiC, central region domain protein [Candidatus Syntrophoarchaeum caldarius]|uniref:Circadian clock protein KaiC, central region domain protein n=1 Tax=Candidatus Syntropharchaeum caldarium TaxID=1838285 RepID=A0A1F2PAA7_9EURY|nr:MAG: Circadian clock protein KaiC, central region domain protein [Candidatus Syntrophoarchaeum caldarius]